MKSEYMKQGKFGFALRVVVSEKGVHQNPQLEGLGAVFCLTLHLESARTGQLS